MEILLHHNADLSYNDPYVTEIELGKKKDDFSPVLSEPVRLKSIELSDKSIENADLILCLVNHSDYDWDRIIGKAKRFFDTRGVSLKYPKYRDKAILL